VTSTLGVKRLAFYCDESGISGDHPYYGFGALIMRYQRRGDFIRDFRDMAGARNWGEVKWTKTTQGTLGYYKRIVDYFFRAPHLYFHVIVVRRDWVNVKEFHEGSYDLARRKHFTQFLVNKVNLALKADPKREHEFRVYVDPIASAYPKADEVVHKVSNSMLAQKLEEHPAIYAARQAQIEDVYTVNSKDRPEIQVCDLLLGAVVEAWNGRSTASQKRELKAHVASYLGWDHLKRTTFASERKFNVWYLTDKHKSDQERPVKATPVNLIYPLPPKRRDR
jgi:Protein of unknown function (DUF3800)